MGRKDQASSWAVELHGDTVDLANLARSLSAPTLTLQEVDGVFHLRSTRFTEDMSAREVRSEAETLARQATGAATLLLGSSSSLKVGNVYRYRADGRRDTWVLLEPGRVNVRALPVSIKITRRDGTVEKSGPTDAFPIWLELAQEDEDVATVLRLLAQDAQDPTNLYRIAERIRQVDSEEFHRWVSKAEWTRCKWSVNHPEVMGDAARHGHMSTKPPPKPMPLAECEELVRRLARDWLRFRANRSHPGEGGTGDGG